MRPRGSSSWTPLTPATRLVAGVRGVERAAGHGVQDRQHAVPEDIGPARVGWNRAKRDRRIGRMDVLPAVWMGQPELLSGGGDAIGGAVRGELGLELVVLGGEAGLFLLQRRDLVARLGGGGRLGHQ